MKFQIFSDLHLELRTSYPKIKPCCELLILAGDIGHIDCELYREFMEYCSVNWKHLIIVLGNHEFYDTTRTYKQLLNTYKQYFLNFRNMYLLDSEVIVFEDVYFYGSTMFTSALPEFLEARIKSFDTRRTSFDQFQQLELFLNTHQHLNKVVITHYPLTRDFTCIPEKFHNQSELKFKYHCNHYLHMFSNKYLEKVLCVISGHTHRSYDFTYKNVRCISNQYGYPNDQNELYDMYVEL
jgi:predicted phosphodiesterase